MRVLPVGTSHKSPEKPPTQVHSGIPSSFASAHVPPVWHGLGLQAEYKRVSIVVEILTAKHRTNKIYM